MVLETVLEAPGAQHLSAAICRCPEASERYGKAQARSALAAADVTAEGVAVTDRGTRHLATGAHLLAAVGLGREALRGH